MNKRKDQLRSLFGVSETAPETKSATVSPAEAPKRSSSGAVKAMGLSLGALGQEVEDARRLRDSLAAAESVIEVDAGRIERSPYNDRLSSGAQNDEDFAALKESIAANGQQVPVLLRPHPDAEKAAAGYYQTAYGHRRVEAQRQLGRPVRAIVRHLGDDELVMAQGKENAERRNLSFIERAFFAAALVDKGFDRSVVMGAMSVDKTELSRLLQVAGSVPPHIAAHIGPAPKAGRPRWVELGELLAKEAKRVIADSELGSQRFRDAATSDARFQLLYNRLTSKAGAKPEAKSAGARPIRSADGASIAEVQHGDARTVFVIPAKAGAGFAEYLAAELPGLHAAFQRRKDADKS